MDSKIIMSKRLLESITLSDTLNYPYPKPEDVLRAALKEEFPFQVPSYPRLHIPIHILVYDVGRRLTARYSSTSWDDVLPRAREDYFLANPIEERFMQYCFEIYHVWMKAEPSEEWLNIPIPPQPGDPLGLMEATHHFEDPEGLDPLDSSSNYEPPSNCSSFESSDDEEVYVFDQWLASKQSVEQWAQLVIQTAPDISRQSFDDATTIAVPHPGANI
ncbi:hypothetical protein ONZ45_g5149 [Pleurotus djamor]|nr:hypothetical protein ONZ45_g5149 [Pleurotus djamor]